MPLVLLATVLLATVLGTGGALAALGAMPRSLAAQQTASPPTSPTGEATPPAGGDTTCAPGAVCAAVVPPGEGDTGAPSVTILPGTSSVSGYSVSVTVTWCDDTYLNGQTRRFTLNGQSLPTTSFSFVTVSTSYCPSWASGMAARSTGTISLAAGQNVFEASINDGVPNTGSDVVTYSRLKKPPQVTPDGALRALPASSAQSIDFVIQNTDMSASNTYALAATCSGALVACTAPKVVTLGPQQQMNISVGLATGGSGSSGRVVLHAADTLNSVVADTGYVDVIGESAVAGVVIARELKITDRDLCVTAALGRSAAYQCGDLRLIQTLPAVAAVGKTYAPALLYNSAYARATVRVVAAVTLPNDGQVPSSVSARLLIGSAQEASGSWSGNDWTAGSTRQIVLSADLLSKPTGLYPYSLEVTRWYGSISQSQVVTGELAVVNRSSSPFGAGWWLVGYEQLISVSSNRWMWVGGDGSTRVFSPAGTNVWVTTNLDRPDSLVFDGTYYWRWLPQRGAVLFDRAGRHVQTRNALAFASPWAHRTWFYYDTFGRLARIRPKALAQLDYVLSYDGAGKLQSVTAPPSMNGSRITTITNSIGRVQRIRYPDSTTVDFAYGDGVANRITGRTDRRGISRSFTFGAANVLTGTSLTLASGQTLAISLQPQEARGATGGAAVSPALAYTRLDWPRTDVGDSVLFWLDRFGAPVRVRNALGYETLLERGDARWSALITRVQYPSGQVLGAAYDTRGNLQTLTDSSSYRDGPTGRRYATTSYVWDQVCDEPTKVTRPEGDSVRSGYDVVTCNLLWTEDGRGLATRVVYRYYDSLAVAGLLRAVQTPDGARDSLAYDAPLSNLATTWTPSGVQTRFERDGIGRLTTTRTQLDSAATLWQDDSLSYDRADRPTREVKYAPATTDGAEQRLVARKYYDAEGQLDSLQREAMPDTNNVGVATTRWRYDYAGRRVAEVSPDRLVDSTVYDPAGNSIAQLTRRGHLVAMAYDALGRLVRRITPSVVYADTVVAAGDTTWRFPRYPNCQSTKLCIAADTATFSYDAAGNMTSAINAEARISRAYNPNGTLAADTLRIRTIAALSSGGDFSTHVYGLRFGYDLNARRAWMKLSSSLAARNASGVIYDSVAYAYDPQTGQLQRIRDILGNDFTYTYDLLGRVERLGYPLGHYKKYTYDLDGQPIRLRQDQTSTKAGDYNEIRAVYTARGQLAREYPNSLGRV